MRKDDVNLSLDGKKQNLNLTFQNLNDTVAVTNQNPFTSITSPPQPSDSLDRLPIDSITLQAQKLEAIKRLDEKGILDLGIEHRYLDDINASIHFNELENSNGIHESINSLHSSNPPTPQFPFITHPRPSHHHHHLPQPSLNDPQLPQPPCSSLPSLHIDMAKRVKI